MEAECEDGTVLHWEIRRSIAQACVEGWGTGGIGWCDPILERFFFAIEVLFEKKCRGVQDYWNFCGVWGAKSLPLPPTPTFFMCYDVATFTKISRHQKKTRRVLFWKAVLINHRLKWFLLIRSISQVLSSRDVSPGMVGGFPPTELHRNIFIFFIILFFLYFLLVPPNRVSEMRNGYGYWYGNVWIKRFKLPEGEILERGGG